MQFSDSVAQKLNVLIYLFLFAKKKYEKPEKGCSILSHLVLVICDGDVIIGFLSERTNMCN